jgi:hypothetical protein
MSYQRLVKHLELLGCDRVQHTGRPLSDHLQGTYLVLKSWGCKKYVCRAGLFHNLYGTPRFEQTILEYANRLELVKMIGTKAELLVFFFSFISIEDLKKAKPTNKNIVIHLRQFELEISFLQYKQLIEIALANYLEQRPHLSKGNRLDKKHKKFSWAKGLVNTTAFNSYLSPAS